MRECEGGRSGCSDSRLDGLECAAGIWPAAKRSHISVTLLPSRPTPGRRASLCRRMLGRTLLLVTVRCQSAVRGISAWPSDSELLAGRPLSVASDPILLSWRITKLASVPATTGNAVLCGIGGRHRRSSVCKWFIVCELWTSLALSVAGVISTVVSVSGCGPVDRGSIPRLPIFCAFWRLKPKAANSRAALFFLLTEVFC